MDGENCYHRIFNIITVQIIKLCSIVHKHVITTGALIPMGQEGRPLNIYEEGMSVVMSPPIF